MSKGSDIWHVYMVRCSDGTLYTGITKDLDKRVKAHNSAKNGARYTRSRRPVKLVYAEQAESKSAAARLEYQIRKQPRSKKSFNENRKSRDSRITRDWRRWISITRTVQSDTLKYALLFCAIPQVNQRG